MAHRPWAGHTLEQPLVVGAPKKAGARIYPNMTATSWRNGALRLVRSDIGEEAPAVRASVLVSVTARLPEDGLHAALSLGALPEGSSLLAK